MTQDEFVAKFRGRMLLFIAEAWAARRETPSSLGIVFDKHALEGVALLREFYNVLQPKGPQK